MPLRTNPLVALLGVVALTGCIGGSEAPERAPVKVDFQEVQGTWKLAPSAMETRVAMVFGDKQVDFDTVPGACAPTSELPFTEVQGQKALAALACDSPDGGKHQVVLVEVMGEDPTWPAPVGLAMVLTRPSDEGKVALVTMGMQELPLGVIPKPPPVAGPVPGDAH